MSECKYCHNQHQTKQGKWFGDTCYDRTEWYGSWERTRKFRKRVKSSISSPEFKHPKLNVRVQFHDGSENMMDVSIKYCPWCGRRLGEY